MELRSGIYKGVHGTLSEQCRSQFAEGLSLLFSRWTALGLAIDNEWGGPSSRQKAEQLYEDVLHWFFTHTGPKGVPFEARRNLLPIALCHEELKACFPNDHAVLSIVRTGCMRCVLGPAV